MARTPVRGLLVAAVLTLPLLGAQPALADDDDLIREGSCTEGAEWKVKASAEDGRVEVEGEVDSNKVGQTWRWKIKHDGGVSARGRATTEAPSGSFEASELLVDLAGTDKFVFRAKHRPTGQICRGVLRY